METLIKDEAVEEVEAIKGEFFRLFEFDKKKKGQHQTELIYFQMDASNQPQKRRRRRLFRLSEWRDWAGLPMHLLSDIFNKMSAIDDYIHFGRVCVPWESVFQENIKKLGSPLFLIAPPSDHQDYYNHRALYSLSTKRVYDLHMQIPHNKFCRGSSFGWVVAVEEKHPNQYHVQLQNLFLHRIIDLPPLDNIVRLQVDLYCGLTYFHYLCKAVLSCDPFLSDNYIVMCIMSRYQGLAFLKSGDTSWTPIGEHWISDWEQGRMFSDVIYSHSAGQFYALLTTGAVLAVKFSGDTGDPKLTQVAPPLRNRVDEMYLVEDPFSGDLLQIHKEMNNIKRDHKAEHYVSIRFTVFQFAPTEQKWIKIQNLGGRVIFLGCNCSILRSALDCPGSVPDRIYYTNDYHWGNDFPSCYKPPFHGIYNLEDGTIQPHYLLLTPNKPLPPPIWLEPTFK